MQPRSDHGQRPGNNPDMHLAGANAPILQQATIHQPAPQLNGAASGVIGLGGEPGLYGSSTISRPAWKWWRYFYITYYTKNKLNKI